MKMIDESKNRRVSEENDDFKFEQQQQQTRHSVEVGLAAPLQRVTSNCVKHFS